MFEEPRFIPGADLVELSRFATVDQVPGHNNGLVDWFLIILLDGS